MDGDRIGLAEKLEKRLAEWRKVIEPQSGYSGLKYTRLRAETDTQAAASLRSADAEIARLRALLAQAEAALEPFAHEVGRFGRGNEPCAVTLTMLDRRAIDPIELAVKHFDAARSTLAAIRAAKEKTP